MDEFFNSISFRVEFFSLPTFKDSYVSYLAKVFQGVPFKETILGQSEWQQIDVDTIAMDLDIPIVNIMEHKNYIFDEIFVGGLKSKVYISPYYIFIYIPISHTDVIGDTLEADLHRILDKDCLKNTQIQKISCIVNHYLNIPSPELFKSDVLDTDAFPQIDPDKINMGRYSDSHQTEDGIQLRLIRDIDRGRDKQTDADYFSINITSVSTKNKSDDEAYKYLLDLALEETASCFK